ncbi:MAG: PKD domain-containing protein [Solirubrobacterales bacterium]|nr:PKD domain-containing protein [Solirubrobacterales bacterium]
MPARGLPIGRASIAAAPLRRCAPVALVVLMALLGPLSGRAPAQPNPGPPVVVDGPTPSIAAPTALGLSIARDGTGALVYLKQVAGVPHVFVSALLGGSFQTPQQLDGALPGPSSQPVVATGNGGLAIVAFINGGALYEVTRRNALLAWGQATALATGAASPAIQMSNFGKAYVAFTAADGAGHDVRAAYYYNGAWALEGSPLNNLAADDAGTGNGRPAVTAAGDGVGIVAWGEGGHIFTRRVWGIAPSIILEQADAPLPGCTELFADQPAIGAGGDSSYAAVAFHEQLSCGGQTQSRVLMNRLQASIYDGVSTADGLPAGNADSAQEPRVTVAEYGSGWVTSAWGGSDNVFATLLGGNASHGGVLQINAEPNAGDPYVVPATAGLYSSLIAWQHDPGAAGYPDIRARYASSGGTSLGPEMMLSSPAQGPAYAAAGIAAAGDVNGDAAVSWVQGSPSAAEIVVAELYQAPAPIDAVSSFQYSRSSRALLAWAPQRASWGPITYTVSVDGAPVGQTGATSFTVPSLLDGSHSWTVVAANPAGLTSTMAPARVFVDTHPPAVAFTLTGTRRAGATVHIALRYSDTPPGLPASHGSGVAKATVYWGDGTPHVQISHGAVHVYKRPGRYKIRVVVQDRAGNTTTVSRYVKIAAPKTTGKPKPARAKHG